MKRGGRVALHCAVFLYRTPINTFMIIVVIAFTTTVTVKIKNDGLPDFFLFLTQAVAEHYITHHGDDPLYLPVMTYHLLQARVSDTPDRATQFESNSCRLKKDTHSQSLRKPTPTTAASDVVGYCIVQSYVCLI